jgi:predicted DNA-binding transcriptional regulator YafY
MATSSAKATIGRHGGYRLRPGFKLPPLLFTDEEATAIVLGLLGTAWLEIGQSPVAVEGALAKVLRVLPLRARERLSAIASHLVLSPHEQDMRPDAALLIQLSDAIQQQLCVAIDYRSQQDDISHRTVEPYAVAGWWGRWYLVGYCRLRRGFRSFRLDRVQSVEVLAESFVRAKDFDSQAYVREHVGKISSRWQIVVEFFADLETVRQKIPASYGSLEATPAGVLFRGQHGDMGSTARYLASLNLRFIVHDPPELRDAIRHLAEQMLASVNTV